MTIHDITHPLFSAPVYPGDPAPAFTRLRQMPRDPYNLTQISLCVHNGTHIDAPRHFIENGAGVGSLPLDIFYGACTVAPWDGMNCSILLARRPERLLLQGDADVTPDHARDLVKAGVRLLGVTSQSVGSLDTPKEVHEILLGANIVLLEGLVLAHVAPGDYTLAAFPLNLGADCDGSPVRAVLISTQR